MAKRRKFSRWRRLPGVYRIGDDKPPERSADLERLTLYINGHTYDLAESQALRLGFESAQEYCTDLVVRAVRDEQVRGHVAEVEAKRGALAGLNAIADDPEYLAELRAAAVPRDEHPTTPAFPSFDEESDEAHPSIRFLEDPPAIPIPERDATTSTPALVPQTPLSAPILTRVEPSAAALVVLKHAGASQVESDDFAFLPSLRRGQSVPPEAVAELGQALQDLEQEYRGRPTMERALTFALHRLAFEGQILHTDAYPGGFDVWTVEMLRAVQEAVERILSGQDIRYYPEGHDPVAVPTSEDPR